MAVPTTPGHLIFDMADPTVTNEAVAEALREHGVAVLRNTLSDEALALCRQRAERILEAPAIGGAFGYYQKDPHKKVFPAFLLGRCFIDAIANERTLDIVDQVFGCESLLAEAYLKQDLGTNRVYFPVHTDIPVDHDTCGARITEDVMAEPFAIGGMLYLYDTDAGAFCYALGTHRSDFRAETRLEKTPLYHYSKEFQRKVAERLTRMKGRAGDILIYDDRAFHGPEQPADTSRTVVIWDHFSTKVFGRVQKGVTPVLTTDLTSLTHRQLRFIGVDATADVEPETYHLHAFKRHRGYRWLARGIESIFAAALLKNRLKDAIKRRRTRHATWSHS